MQTKNAIERVADVARKRIYALGNDDDWQIKMRNSRYANFESESQKKKTDKNK